MTINKADYLEEVLDSHKMKHINDLVETYKNRRNEIKSFLKSEFSGKIYEPFDSGSYKKHTAMNAKFDLDLVVPFTHDSFKLEDMYCQVYEKLKEEFGKRTTVREQGVSIGLTFEEDDPINIDVVPARETSQGNYPNEKNLNLHKQDGSGYLKTNIHAQIDHISGRTQERRIIRLLKIWKFYGNNPSNKKFKSFFFELLVIKAFGSKSISGNLWEQLKAVLEYVIENVTNDSFKLIDPGNSNNNLMDSLESWDKSNLANAFQNILNRVDDNSNNLELYFPKNEKFADEQDTKGYGLKSSGLLISTPSTPQRFG